MKVHIDQIANKKQENLNLATRSERVQALIFDIGWILVIYGLLGILVFEVIVRLIPQDNLNITVYLIGLAVVIYGLCIFPLSWLYFSVTTVWMRGYTIGKAVLGIHVEREYKKELKKNIYFVRELVKFLFLLLFPAHLIVFLTKKKQGIHDVLLRTLVVRREYQHQSRIKNLGIIGIILGLTALVLFGGFIVLRSTTALNAAKDSIFAGIYEEGDQEAEGYQEGSMEKLFYDALYESKRTEDEVYKLESLFQQQIYTEENIQFLFSEDFDKDGIVDSLEERYRTNKYVKDSDADGIDDHQEIMNGESPVNRKTELPAKNNKEWEDFIIDGNDFAFQIPKGWNYRRSEEDDYFFGKPDKTESLIEDILISVTSREVEYADLHASFYFPDLYESAAIIEPIKVNGMNADLLTFIFDIRAVIIRDQNKVLALVEILPDDIEDGVFNYMIASVQKGEEL